MPALYVACYRFRNATSCSSALNAPVHLLPMAFFLWWLMWQLGFERWESSAPIYARVYNRNACLYQVGPTIRFMDTEMGAMAVRRSSEWLEQWVPSWHASVAKLSLRVYGSPSGRTFAEWILLNKVDGLSSCLQRANHRNYSLCSVKVHCTYKLPSCMISVP